MLDTDRSEVWKMRLLREREEWLRRWMPREEPSSPLWPAVVVAFLIGTLLYLGWWVATGP
jgi:hypothetical protein